MKKLLFAATGGTVACEAAESGKKPVLSAKKLLECVGVPDDVKIVYEEPMCADSTCMTRENWLELAKIVRKNYEKFDGFVITHGTDTLGYAAAALSCLIENSRKPVVLTGSMMPLMAAGSDAAGNIRGAISYAAAQGAWGVRVVFGGVIIDGRSAVKVHTGDADAFRSVNRPEAGFFGADGIPRFSEMFSGETRFFDKLDGRVETVFLTPGMRAPLIREDTRAVIILGFGTGGLPFYLDEWLGALSKRGVYIIMSTQVLRGGTNLGAYEVGRRVMEKYDVVEAGKMTAEYCVMRASAALARSDDPEDFRRIFLEE